MENFKHLILTRFDYPDSFPFLQERINLFHKFCKPSIKSQTNQNFEWVILSRKPITFTENDCFKVLNAKELSGYIRSLNTKKVITTRFDCDDSLLPKFVESVQNEISNKTEIIDFNGYRYDIRHDKFYMDTKYHNQFLSPFISLIEDVEYYKGIYYDQHTKMKLYFPFKKINSRQWIQVIHDHNWTLNKYSEEELAEQGILLDKPINIGI